MSKRKSKGLRPFRDVLSDVMGDIERRVIRFPFEETISRFPNHPRMGWIFAAVAGLPPARQKRIILQSRSPEVAVLDDVEAGLMLDALGIRES